MSSWPQIDLEHCLQDFQAILPPTKQACLAPLLLLSLHIHPTQDCDLMTGSQKSQTGSYKSFKSVVSVGGLNCWLHNSSHIFSTRPKKFHSGASRDGNREPILFGNGSHCFHSCELFVHPPDDSTAQDTIAHMLHCLNSELTCPRYGSAPKCGHASPDGNLCYTQHNKAQAAQAGGSSSNVSIQFVCEFLVVFAAVSPAIYSAIFFCQQLSYMGANMGVS